MFVIVFSLLVSPCCTGPRRPGPLDECLGLSEPGPRKCSNPRGRVEAIVNKVPPERCLCLCCFCVSLVRGRKMS